MKLGTRRILHLAAVTALATALGGCGLVGNFNDYTVRCASNAQTEKALHAVVDAVGKTRNEKPETDTNPDCGYNAVFRRDLFIWFFYRPGSTLYFIDLRREWNRAEDTEIITARNQIETGIRQSVCPDYERVIRHYKATNWAH